MSRIDTDRDNAIVESYRSKKTLDEVGKEFGISRERVRQILVRNGVTKRNGHGVVYARKLAKLDPTEVLAHYRAAGDMRKTARHFGVSPESIQRVIGSEITELDKRRAYQKPCRSDEELMGALRDAARLSDEPALTIAQYKLYRAAFPSVPSEQTIMMRFGGWRSALAKVGLNGYDCPPWLGVKYSDTDVYAALLRIRSELGKFPTVEEYEQYALPDEPTRHTIRKRLGGWIVACGAALEYEKGGPKSALDVV